ncbi:MAG: anti-sigma factor antagonist, partial [Candidatus Latescibacteria bacterium]|nr:anti-sigma factor antagonist [Candidatus Latescibacterota bacterium]
MNELQIEEEVIKGVVVIKLSGLVDSANSHLLENRLSELIEDGHVKLVFDLSDIDYISSAGWGIFVSEMKGIREREGDLKLSGMSPDVRDVFELLEFDSLLTPYDDVS